MKGIPSWLTRQIGSPLLMVAGLSVVGLLVSFLEAVWQKADLLAQLRSFMLAASVLALLVGVLQKKRAITVVAGVGVLLGLVFVLPGLMGTAPDTSDVEDGGRFRVMYHNLLTSNPRKAEEIQLILEHKPHVIVVSEIDAAWQAALEEIEDVYPHVTIESREDNFGMAIYSRLPLLEMRIEDFSGAGIPSFVAKVQVEEDSVTIVGTHPVPPVRREMWKMRNRHLDDLAGYVREIEGPVLVVGDLNAAPWTRVYQNFLKKSGLRSAGVPLKNTWSAFGSPILGLPIDHQLVNSELRYCGREVGDFNGSDHRWIMGVFRIR